MKSAVWSYSRQATNIERINPISTSFFFFFFFSSSSSSSFSSSPIFHFVLQCLKRFIMTVPYWQFGNITIYLKARTQAWDYENSYQPKVVLAIQSYSGTSMARTLMARLPRLFRTLS